MAKLPALLEPQSNVESLRLAVSLMKEAVDIIRGVRGPPNEASPTAKQLIDLGVISQEDWDRLPK